MQLPQETSFQNQCILYVDDAENQLSFKALFRRKFPIFTVEHLSEAKEMTRRYPVKIVFSNQQYPIHTAVEFLQWVKQFDANIIRIFVYCNDYQLPSEDMISRYKDLVHQFLWKPWDTAEMESILAKWWNQ